MANPGTLGKVLDKLKEAATPQRFTQDFVADTLAFKGQYALAVIPFLKKIGFLSGDGSPTEIYKRFRNDNESGRAMAEAIRIGYGSLFKINEKVYELSDDQLKGLIVQATGGKKDDSATKFILQCFKALKARAVFEGGALVPATKETGPESGSAKNADQAASFKGSEGGIGMNLSYTINLNLPPSTDIAVFNAIFQSLRKNLLRDE
jgi:Family of unknown function (DUF5343)